MRQHLAASSQENFSLPNEYNTTECSKIQVIDFDDNDNELTTKFIPKKQTSLLLSESYFRLAYYRKSDRVFNCGTFLQFSHSISTDGLLSDKGKLHLANFCKDRLCPLCSWRRSYKIFSQVSQIMNIIASKYKFLFLTLTVPNCTPDLLSYTISRLTQSFRTLTRYKLFKSTVKGFFRALEVTRNNNNGTYHPHFHIVLAVDKSYGSGRQYISRDKWLEMWQKAYKDNSITQVDIRLAKGKKSQMQEASDYLSAAVAEVAKYAVKDSDYIKPGNEVLTDDIVSVLADAFHGRRFTAFGGCFKEAYQRLKLDDTEDGDLVHLQDKQIEPALAWLIVKYSWSCGVYKLCSSFVKFPDITDPTS